MLSLAIILVSFQFLFIVFLIIYTLSPTSILRHECWLSFGPFALMSADMADCFVAVIADGGGGSTKTREGIRSW
jgi:hypothetical protein